MMPFITETKKYPGMTQMAAGSGNAPAQNAGVSGLPKPKDGELGREELFSVT